MYVCIWLKYIWFTSAKLEHIYYIGDTKSLNNVKY
mgnify:CR=1 FL=1